MPRRTSRRNGLLVGGICTIAGALIFASIALEGTTPQSFNSAHRYHRASEVMPTWMAISVGGLFGLVGLTSLIPAVFDLQLSKRMTHTIAMLILTYFLSFADIVCVRSVVVADQFISFPFVAEGVTKVFNWAIWGLFIVFFSSSALACLVRIFKPSATDQ